MLLGTRITSSEGLKAGGDSSRGRKQIEIVIICKMADAKVGRRPGLSTRVPSEVKSKRNTSVEWSGRRGGVSNELPVAAASTWPRERDRPAH